MPFVRGCPSIWARSQVPGRVLFGYLLPLVTLLTGMLHLAVSCHAQEETKGFSNEPVLQLETGLHGAQIRDIQTDADNRFAVTASDDKTARLWSLPDGKLLRIFRLPLGPGNIVGEYGKAYASAISPDGSTIAVGGLTGPPDHSNIYLFDRVSGELIKRLKDVPVAIVRLAYSPDGKHLAACLGWWNGVLVYDVSKDYQLLPSDTSNSQVISTTRMPVWGRALTERVGS